MARFLAMAINSLLAIRSYCNKLYIGETGRRLGDRFREHVRDVIRNDKDAFKPIARHFNLLIILNSVWQSAAFPYI